LHAFPELLDAPLFQPKAEDSGTIWNLMTGYVSLAPYFRWALLEPS
jgi:hypothetical protein